MHSVEIDSSAVYLILEFTRKIRDVVNLSIVRLVFEAWKHVAMDSRKTREYFEVTL